MDLISRNELIKYINDHVKGESDWAREIRQDFLEMVQNQPNAYDVDSAVERLKESDFYIDQEKCITVEDAISIVKGGLEE